MSKNKESNTPGKIIKASELASGTHVKKINQSSPIFRHSEISGLSFIDIQTLPENVQKFINQIQPVLEKRLAAKITCIGCYKSDFQINNRNWDYRPLFVNKADASSLILLRIIKPGVKLNPSLEMAWNNLSGNLPRSYLAAGLNNFTDFFDQNRIYWAIRKFHKSTVSQEKSQNISGISNSDAINAIQGLLTELETLDKLLCPHGNLISSNIGCDDRNLFLLDPWIYSNSNKDSLNQADKQTLGPRGLASFLLKFYANNLSEKPKQTLIKFISSETNNLSFSDLNHVWQSDNSQINHNYQEISAENKSDERANSTKILLAPTGKVINAISATNSEFSGSLNDKNTIIKPDFHRNINFKSRSLFFFFIALASAVMVLFGSGYLDFQLSLYSQKELIADWESKDPQKISELAKSAILDGDKKVQAFISMQLLQGQGIEGLDANFLKNAFNPLWFDELSEEDRRFAMAVTFSPFFKTPSELLPDVNELHPALVFALIGKLKTSLNDQRLTEIGIDKLTSLPASYGSVYKGLKDLGFESIADINVRAVTRIISNNFESDDIAIILDQNNDENQIIKIISLIAPFSESNPKIAEQIFEQAAVMQDSLGIKLRWFTEEPITEWQSLPSKDLLFIALGLIPDDLKQIDKLSDLLLFPNQRVRQKAMEKIILEINAPELRDLFNMLVVNPSILTRAQAISLVAINQGTSKNAAAFVSSWLELEPDAGVVLEFLLCSRDRKNFDESAIQLANYLARKDFDISQRQLPLLLSHPEALARTLAFPRLDPSKELDRKILETWYETESSDRIKQEIKIKLAQK